MNKYERIAQINQVFTPGYPVSHQDMFAGRMDQLQRVIETLHAPGRHPVMFGQRGVGKTSLANILGQVLKDMLSVKISCDGADTFATVWNRVLVSASVRFKQKALGFSGEDTDRSMTLGQALGHDPNSTKPAEVADLLRRMNAPAVIILDEFDKLTDPQIKSQFADLIKIVSDTAPLVTIVMVGVAENIHELVGQHESIQRNLVHVELPLMSDAEIETIYTKGLDRLGIGYKASVVSQIPVLAGGFPHYAHLLGLASAKAVIHGETTEVAHAQFDQACAYALADAIEKYRDAFARATATTQASRYPRILAACGHARTDGRGVFRATDVVDAFRQVFGEAVSVQAVVPALGEFLSTDRAEVLKAVSVAGRQCYRFAEPMMRPYCRLKAMEILGFQAPRLPH
ncbi:ATP-binding protein [Rubrivivax sp. JA1024]|nr:ATP-binding protein [Rubrivivax sp. JA1024]